MGRQAGDRWQIHSGWIKIAGILAYYSNTHPDLLLGFISTVSYPLNCQLVNYRFWKLWCWSNSDRFPGSWKTTYDSQKFLLIPSVSPTPHVHTKIIPHITECACDLHSYYLSLLQYLAILPYSCLSFPSDPQSQVLLPFVLDFQSHGTTPEDPLTAPGVPVPLICRSV